MNAPHHSRRQRGLTLVETMISLALGMLLVISLVAVFVSGNRNYRQDHLQAKMQQSARFALKTLGDEIAMLGFFGNHLTASGSTGFTLDSDCGATGTPWALDIGRPFRSHVNQAGSTVETMYGCVDDQVFVDGTDVLSIKRAEALPVSRTIAESSHADMVFLRTSPSAGASLVLYDGTSTTAPHFSDWRYLAHLYYIRNESLIGSGDGIPTLYRKELRGTDIVENDGGIARGIEYFHVEFGIDAEAIDGLPDTVPDSAPNFYTDTPSDLELDAAVTAKIHVLARSTEEIPGYTNDKVYRLGNMTRGAFNDGYYRRVFSTTIHIRNVSNRSYVQHIVDSI